MNRMWSKEDIQKLKKMAADGISVEEMADTFDRTPTAIRVYAKKHKIKLRCLNCHWTKTEEDEFASDWADSDITKPMLLKKYKHTWKALQTKAYKLGLGRRPISDVYVSQSDVAMYMQVELYTVRNWIHTGLKTHRSRTNKSYKNMIDTDELLEFLEQHQHLFDASKISPYLFFQEPEWLKDKRKHDVNDYNTNRNAEWTISDDNRMVMLFDRGYSDEELAKIMKRSESAIQAHRFILGLIRPHNYYTDEEEKILLSNSGKTLDELEDLLPERSRQSIIRKCKLLGVDFIEKRKDT